uniref:NADH:ubiquinone oxidoreductase 30kDa subunit domain-containing protein n=1 Tax=Solanum lycopersicum TaxID=4081 RepID=A0A3Q7FI91_SOLLC
MDNQFIFKYSWETLPKKWTNTNYLFQLLCFMKLHTYTRVQVSIDICGVDYPSRKQRFEVVYNLLSIRYNSRIRVQTSADKVIRIFLVVNLFPSAGRWEREVWDVFGVSHQSSGSTPYINRLWFRGSSIMKRTSSYEMTQEFRYFNFSSPWEQRSDG